MLDNGSWRPHVLKARRIVQPAFSGVVQPAFSVWTAQLIHTHASPKSWWDSEKDVVNSQPQSYSITLSHFWKLELNWMLVIFYLLTFSQTLLQQLPSRRYELASTIILLRQRRCLAKWETHSNQMCI